MNRSISLSFLLTISLVFTIETSLANTTEAIQIKKDSVRVFVVAPGITYLVDRIANLCFFQRTFVKEQKALEQMNVIEVSCDKLKKHAEIDRFFNLAKAPKDDET